MALSLNNTDKKTLLKIARQTLLSIREPSLRYTISQDEITPELEKKYGAFVSLYHGDELRGCIGRFKTDQPLYKVVSDTTFSAALNDHRFLSVHRSEINAITIEISVLSPLSKIKSIEEIEMGKHGIYIKKGVNSGTYLPQVADKTNWSREEFLGHCSRDKAGLGWDDWMNAEIFIYEALIIKEKE